MTLQYLNEFPLMTLMASIQLRDKSINPIVYLFRTTFCFPIMVHVDKQSVYLKVIESYSVQQQLAM